MPEAYVAGSIHDRDRVRIAQATVRDLGWTIHLDWTEPEWDEKPRAEAAGSMRLAAVRAEILVLVQPIAKSQGLGCYVEAGIRLGNAGRSVRSIFIVGSRSSIFFDACRWVPDLQTLRPALLEYLHS